MVDLTLNKIGIDAYISFHQKGGNCHSSESVCVDIYGLTLEHSFCLKVADTLEVISGDVFIYEKELEKIHRWLLHNKEIIEKYWFSEIGSGYLLMELRIPSFL